MKIRNLSGAIRKLEGPAFVVIDTDIGRLRLPLMKSGVLAAIKEAQPDGMAETDLSVTEAGDLEGWNSGFSASVRAVESALVDLVTGDGTGEVLLEIAEVGDGTLYVSDPDSLLDETIDIEDVIAAAPTTETLDDDLLDLL